MGVLVKSISGGFQAPTGAEPPPKTNFWIRPWTNATAAETQSCIWRSQIQAEFKAGFKNQGRLAWVYDIIKVGWGYCVQRKNLKMKR